MDKLTEREKQCLYWASQDKTLAETAEQLFLSPETIKFYRKVLLRKLNCRTMTGALTVALREGSIQHDWHERYERSLCLNRL